MSNWQANVDFSKMKVTHNYMTTNETIDDILCNCHDWDSKGGISLLHTSQEQTLNNLRILLND